MNKRVTWIMVVVLGLTVLAGVMGCAGSNANAGAEPLAAPLTTATTADLSTSLLGSVTSPEVAGRAVYRLDDGGAELAVVVRAAAGAAGRTVGVFVDGAPVGNLSLDAEGKGELRATGQDGQAVPAVTTGSTIELRQDDDVLASGQFAVSDDNANDNDDDNANDNSDDNANDNGDDNANDNGDDNGDDNANDNGDDNANDNDNGDDDNANDNGDDNANDNDNGDDDNANDNGDDDNANDNGDDDNANDNGDDDNANGDDDDNANDNGDDDDNANDNGDDDDNDNDNGDDDNANNNGDDDNANDNDDDNDNGD